MIKNADISVLIENPGLFKNANIQQLSEIVEYYPYFQTAHILLLKALKDRGSDNFKTQLEKSSIYISDRDLLFKFLNQEFETTETQVEEVIDDEKEKSKEEAEVTEEPNLLKNKKVRRKIVDSAEGMGANISETIASQIVFSSLKNKDKLEYPSEIYFIEEERDGKNHVVTIDAVPDQNKTTKKDKRILDLDEEEAIEENNSAKPESNSEDAFELIDSEEVEKDNNEGSVKNGYFDINSYADDSEMELKDDLITRFIEKNPRIETKEDKDNETIDISEDSIKEDSNLLSETLIKVYIKQGLFEKAIESYKKLSLKYPEKSAYFASQIKILEDKLNKS